jgi:hypothetical protein
VRELQAKRARKAEDVALNNHICALIEVSVHSTHHWEEEVRPRLACGQNIGMSAQ